jgi:hypothetical protein
MLSHLLAPLLHLAGGPDTRDGTLDPAAAAAGMVAGWRSGEDREARDAALSAELARYLIRSEPLGMDRHHQRYWHMQVGHYNNVLHSCWTKEGGI